MEMEFMSWLEWDMLGGLPLGYTGVQSVEMTMYEALHVRGIE
jgi:hypothetical protein